MADAHLVGFHPAQEDRRGVDQQSGPGQHGNGSAQPIGTENEVTDIQHRAEKIEEGHDADQLGANHGPDSFF